MKSWIVTLVIGLLSLTAAESICHAATKEECVDAHSKGQDMRERGQLVRAHQTFLMCAQSSCPGLIQSDCARFSEDLSQLVPTVIFSARDGASNDLPNTSVFVDDVLFATRLDDGKIYELDPGKHIIRFVHETKDTSLKVVVNQGERARLLMASFSDSDSPKTEPTEAAASASSSGRSAFPLVVAGLGLAAATTGTILYGVGSNKVPDGCNISARECAVPPSDPTLAQARSGMQLQNAGLTVGIAGASVLVGGLIWYFLQPSGSSESKRGQIPQTWVSF